MRIHRDISYIDEGARGCSAAIGNFDGVHLGHRAVLDTARAAVDAPLGVVTFEPHPREFFAPDAPPFRLTSAETRAHRLEKIGVEHLFELRFDARLASLTAEEFARDVLSRALGLAHVTVGADFRFGRGREGDAEALRRFGLDFGFGVTLADLVATGGLEVSSTRIREALSAGEPEAAAAMLGHLHRIEGVVVQGEQRGRVLGYPTANISVAGLHLPKLGVYAVRVAVLDGANAGHYDGVASLGVRPMFGDNTPNLETYLFDFAGDLYGARISVALVSYLRPEEKFESIEALVAQMDRDSGAARGILEAR